MCMSMCICVYLYGYNIYVKIAEHRETTATAPLPTLGPQIPDSKLALQVLPALTADWPQLVHEVHHLEHLNSQAHRIVETNGPIHQAIISACPLAIGRYMHTRQRRYT